jgi:predicted nucleic acid-binding protein
VPLLDSSVVIDALREDERATNLVGSLLARDDPVFASEITRFEVLVGLHAGEENVTEQLLGQFEWIAVTEEVSRLGAALARAYRAQFSGIEDGDYLIAATALQHDADLLTTNVKHFPMLPGLAPAY